MPAFPELDSWLKDFPVEAARERVQELKAELATLQNALDLHESMTGQGAHPNGRPTTKPDAIITVMRENPGHDWRPTEVMHTMIKRQWMPDTPAHQKRFYQTLRRMSHAEDGRIIRIGHGRYRLSPDQGGPTT